MTEPSPSPIPSPTPPSDQSWLDWLLTSLDSLGTSHPSLTWAPALILTTIPSVYLLWRKLRSKLQQKIQGLRTSKEHQKLPPIELPFTVEVGEQRLTLEPTQPQHENTPDGMSNVRLLSAKSTPVPFLDRAETLTRLEMWARSEERFAIHILGGDGGSGKTRLGVELCRRLTEPNAHRRGGEVWKAGFLQNIAQSDHTSSNDDTSSLLIVMDYAEGQPEMVTEIINFALRAAKILRGNDCGSSSWFVDHHHSPPSTDAPICGLMPFAHKTPKTKASIAFLTRPQQSHSTMKSCQTQSEENCLLRPLGHSLDLPILHHRQILLDDSATPCIHNLFSS